MSAERAVEGAGRSEKFDIKAALGAVTTTATICFSGYLGGRIAGGPGAYAGGLVGLAVSLAVAAKLSGYSDSRPTS